MSVTILETVRQISNQSVIEVLEHALEEARAGDITAVSVALVRPDGAANAYNSSNDQVAGLLGALTLAQVRIVNSIEDED